MDILDTVVSTSVLVALGLVLAWMGNRRFDAIDRRFEAVDRRFEAVDQRFETLGSELRGEIASLGSGLRGEIATLGSELRGEIASLGSELRGEIASLGSELRIDGTLGSDPGAGIELYEPMGRTPLFVTGAAGITNEHATTLADDEIVARYGITRSRLGFALGANLGRQSDVRVGAHFGRVDATIEIGNPRLPELKGAESGLSATWRFDGQDSPAASRL